MGKLLNYVQFYRRLGKLKRLIFNQIYKQVFMGFKPILAISIHICVVSCPYAASRDVWRFLRLIDGGVQGRGPS